MILAGLLEVRNLVGKGTNEQPVKRTAEILVDNRALSIRTIGQSHSDEQNDLPGKW